MVIHICKSYSPSCIFPVYHKVKKKIIKMWHTLNSACQTRSIKDCACNDVIQNKNTIGKLTT